MRVLVRLGGCWVGAVEVRHSAMKNCAVSNRDGGEAIRGGEQRNENDQSLILAARKGRRRELDSVGVVGRVCEWRTKREERAIGEPTDTPD